MGCCESKNNLRNDNVKPYSNINYQNQNKLNYNYIQKESNLLSDTNVSININQKGDINRYNEIKAFEELQ